MNRPIYYKDLITGQTTRIQEQAVQDFFNHQHHVGIYDSHTHQLLKIWKYRK